jgi:large repetitive protein
MPDVARLAAGPPIWEKRAKGGGVSSILSGRALFSFAFSFPSALNRFSCFFSAEFGFPIVDRRLGDPMLASPIGGLHPRLHAPLNTAAPTIASFSTDSGVVGDHITNDATLTLTGTAEANSTVKIYDGSTLLGSAVANGSGAWLYTTTTLTNGAHGFTVTATDATGNVSAASAATSVTIDTVVPNAPVETSASIVSGTTEVKLTGTAEANSTVHVFDGANQIGTATADGSGAWNLTTGNLASGNHSFTANAMDVAGNTSVASAAQTVTIPAAPSAPPAPAITGFSNDSGVVGDHITNDNTLKLTGTAAANSTVTVFDGSTQLGTTTADASGSWSYITSVLTDAIHTSLKATDTISGVTSTASSPLTVSVDRGGRNVRNVPRGKRLELLRHVTKMLYPR